MKKYPKYQLRVGEGLLGRLQAAGADLVREVLEREFGGGDLKKAEPVVAPKETFLKGEGGGTQKVVPAGEGVKGVVQTDVGRVPAWKVKLAAQLAEREKRGFSVLSGETAPAADAAVSTPRSVVFERSEEERAKRMALLRSVATGMKMQPQMEKKTEFYPDDEPNEEP